jgi:hypothetical protein
MISLVVFVPLLWQQRQENCRSGVARIVIALKRNGAYADNIQVQQLGRSELFES